MVNESDGEAYAEFIQTEAYARRVQQVERFSPIAREVLQALVAKDRITDEDLTGLIHLFRPKPVSLDLARKYLGHITADPAQAERLANALVATGFGGYTAPGRLRIHSHTEAELRVVHEFLRDAFQVKDAAGAAALCEAYERKAIRYVTAGIYSPWLHSINPGIFHIQNGATRAYFKQHGLPKEYPALVRRMPELVGRMGIHDLGLLDSFIWHKSNGAQPQDPKDGAWRKARWITEIPRADWDLFFDACNEVIEQLGFDADSPLLAMNMHLNASDGVLMNVSNRATIDMHLGEGPQVMLMLPKGETDRLLDRSEVIETFVFSKPANAEGTRVSMETLRRKHDVLLPAILVAAEEITHRSQSSPFRKHHIPDLYRMATDADFREKALDHLLEGKGECPGATEATEAVNYWIFQCNPKWYDGIAALRDNAVHRWSIDVHKQKIKPGDKAIIWVTGPEGGCCALATVTSPVRPMDTDASQYARTPRFLGVHDRVNVVIDHNLWDRPISRDEAREHLPDLKAGNQGTTFSATKAQYEYFLDRAKAKTSSTMHELNTILYGPPGTGKTYRLREQLVAAMKSLETKDDLQVLDGAKTFWHLAPGLGGHLWEKLKAADRLGYEWCKKSYGDLREEDPKDDSPKNRSIVMRFGEVEKGDYFCVISGRRFLGIAKSLTDYDPTEAVKGAFDFQSLPVEWIRKFDEPELLNASSTKSFTKIGGTRWQSFLDALERQGMAIGAGGDRARVPRRNHRLMTFHQAVSYEDFIEGIKPVTTEGEEEVPGTISYMIEDGLFKRACIEAARLAGYEGLRECIADEPEQRKKKFMDAEPYYFMIDEINRGNVAAAFGELITLLEKDKRLGGDQEMIVDLPYSKASNERFGVPLNLRVIGTMNTADRSVEALDTALRRRFSFIECPSRPEELEKLDYRMIGEVDLSKLLIVINARIEMLLDRDHHIGHSYFMNWKEADKERKLRQVFKNNIIPLLQEYFYGDPVKVGMVLGEAFVRKADVQNGAKVEFAAAFRKEVDIEPRTRYVFQDVMDEDLVPLQAFKDICDGK